MSKKNEKTLSKTFLNMTPNLSGLSRNSIEVMIQKYAKGYRVTIDTANLTYYLIDYDVLVGDKPHTVYRTVEVQTAHGDIVRVITVRTNDANEFMKLIQDSIVRMKNRVNVHNADGFIKLIPAPTWEVMNKAADGTIQIINSKKDDDTIQSIVMLYSSELRMDIRYNRDSSGYYWYRHQSDIIHINPSAIELTNELLQFISELGGSHQDEICALTCNYISRVLLKIDNNKVPGTRRLFEHEIHQLNHLAKHADPRVDVDDDLVDPPYADMDNDIEYF